MLRRAYRSVRATIYRMLDTYSPSTAPEVHEREVRLKTRIRKHWGEKTLVPESDKIHLGCGNRKVEGWLNVDLRHVADYSLDLSVGYLPWQDNSFNVAVSQHLVEHLDMKSELIPLLGELHRTLKPGGEVWITTPDIEKIVRSYIDHRMEDLLEDKKRRITSFTLGDMPSSHLINFFFHQRGEHVNLFDFPLLKWTLERSGYESVTRVSEEDLLNRFPEFPPRNDEAQTLYVKARAADAA